MDEQVKEPELTLQTLAAQVAKLEGGAKEVDIAQIQEVLACAGAVAHINNQTFNVILKAGTVKTKALMGLE